MAVFWVVAPCILVEVHWHFRGPCCLHHQGKQPDDGGSKYLWNVGKLLPDYTAQEPRTQPSSYSPPWEHEISLQWTTLIEKQPIWREMMICIEIFSHETQGWLHICIGTYTNTNMAHYQIHSLLVMKTIIHAELPLLLFLFGLTVLLCCRVEEGPFVTELPANMHSRCKRRHCSFMITVSCSWKV
jgi:hypothetical protein